MNFVVRFSSLVILQKRGGASRPTPKSQKQPTNGKPLSQLY
jgi:hypothetical protein